MFAYEEKVVIVYPLPPVHPKPVEGLPPQFALSLRDLPKQVVAISLPTTNPILAPQSQCFLSCRRAAATIHTAKRKKLNPACYMFILREEDIGLF